MANPIITENQNIGSSGWIVTSYKDGSVVDLTGATLSIVFVSSIGTRKVGTGTWTIDNASQGLAHYTYSSADVSEAGTWTLQVEVQVGGQPAHTDTDILQILPPL